MAKEAGYNMIHFSPLQELGGSRSGYSIRDQLKVNPDFTAPGSPQVDWPQIEELVRFMQNEWAILSMCDLVLNHTASDSPWLTEHPECAYNMVNSPHLVPAFIVDFVIWKMTQLCARGELISRGIPPEFKSSESHVQSIRAYLAEKFTDLKLFEFYQADVEAVSAEFKEWLINDGETSVVKSSSTDLTLIIAGPRAGRRMGGYVDFRLAKKLFGQNVTPDEAAQNMANRLVDLNRNMEETCKHHCWCAIDCVANTVRYRFIESSGPRLQTVTEKTPLVDRYFVWPVREINSVREAEELVVSNKAAHIMACNGWVMNADPLKNFADPDSDVYVRRELVVWGDSVKLRYGDRPEACPYLWDRMLTYAKNSAKIFHAVRLDNCHSTPINVAQVMLDACREVRPNVYILAELFTGNEGSDNMFINKLGINALVREALSAYDCHDQGRMVHHFGGLQPAGAFPRSVIRRRLLPTLPHAMFYDQTHDNESPALKRSIFDYVPSAGLVAMAFCGTASVRGFDEMVPYMIDVVSESRVYSTWDKEVGINSGLIATKAALNKLHKWLSSHRYTETFVDQIDKNVVAVTRFNPDTAASVVLVAHSSFYERNPHPPHQRFRRVVLNGRVKRLLLEARTVNQASGDPLVEFSRDTHYINGLINVKVFLQEDVPVDQSSMFRIVPVDEAGGVDALEFFDFPPGCIMAVSVCLTDPQAEALSRIRGTLLSQFGNRLRNASNGQVLGPAIESAMDNLLPSLPETLEAGLISRLIADLSLNDINWLLFRCEREENSFGIGRKPYFIPGYGELPFCGLQGVLSVLRTVAEDNDMGHALCSHLRDGLWMMDYLIERCVSSDPSHPSKELDALAQAVRQMVEPIYHLPRYLVPSSFGMLIGCLYQRVVDEAVTQMGEWVSTASSAVRHLAVAALQLYGKAPNCRLPPVVPGESFPGPKPTNDSLAIGCSLAAGLPHFAEGMWRNWGRDTFIALRGCLLLLDRFEEAASLILQFGSLMRHGMIPNLMGDGHTVPPRFNARDAVWFWLYSIVCFENAIVEKQGHAPGSLNTGSSILKRKVWRWFPQDDSEGWPGEADKVDVASSSSDPRAQPLYDVMQEALQRHAEGIQFRERNAGDALDCHMKNEGFDVTASIQPDTGFPMGGNAFNCGTWMDKMGGSDRAKNRGIPATPRDGCAVELVGLAYAVVSWLDKMHNADSSYYPHSGVKLANGTSLSWGDWAKLIQRNFEDKFWSAPDANPWNKGYYKDLYGSSNPARDAQLRPNFLVTMAVAPDLFTPEKAWNALETTKNQLLGPLGMRTLAPSDPDYQGYYNNFEDTDQFATSQGFNYHQGPEWLWLTGYYVRARLAIASQLASSDSAKMVFAVREAQEVLMRLQQHLAGSAWRSLPELTNANGEYCHGSCSSQAWSVGCAIEATKDLLKASDGMPNDLRQL
ncbi:hypothetical protein AAHC03_016706 [Spirometra sp. Aus1]